MVQALGQFRWVLGPTPGQVNQPFSVSLFLKCKMGQINLCAGKSQCCCSYEQETPVFLSVKSTQLRLFLGDSHRASMARRWLRWKVSLNPGVSAFGSVIQRHCRHILRCWKQACPFFHHCKESGFECMQLQLHSACPK